jgi:hypothetical protein
VEQAEFTVQFVGFPRPVILVRLPGATAAIDVAELVAEVVIVATKD